MTRNRSFVMVCLIAVCLLPIHGAGATAGLDDATILAIFDQANAADIVTGRAHLGTTREVVARALGQLASAKRIRTGRRQIVINDPVTLAEDVKREQRPRLTRRR